MQAQDIHFSQYRNSPLNLNPAYAGGFFGDWRIATNYRNQWAAVLDKPITTVGISFDKPFYVGKNRIGLGVNLVSDQAGDLGYKSNKIAVTAAYHMLVGDQELRFGLQAAYVIRSIGKNLSFPNGFNRVTGEFDPEISQDAIVKDNSSYLDVNFGVVYSLNFDKFRPEIGLAGFHLNGPKETFFADAAKIDTKIAANLSLKTYLSRNFYIDPNFVLMTQAKANNLITGINLGSRFDPGTSFVSNVFGGFAVRNGFSENPDAVILLTGIGLGDFLVGASYDVNISTLKTGVSGNGTYEFSLIYTAPSTRLIKTKIDSDRL